MVVGSSPTPGYRNVSIKAKDRLVLAGVLAHQRADVEAAYRDLGCTVLEGAQQGEWVRIDLKR